MPRRYGYSLKGKPCYGKHGWHAKGRTNAIGALIGKALLTVGLFPCNINSDVFALWLRKDLLSKLSEPSVIVMDNATFHKRKDMHDAIVKAGHKLIFLPPYSPALNPIEKK